MSCKQICLKYKSKGRYINGSRRCQTCDIFIKYIGVWCPCCGYRLRNNARNPTSKEKRKFKRL